MRTKIPVTAISVTGVPTPAPGCNCATSAFYIDNPDAVEPICSGSNTDCSYCGCARQSSCGECSIRCGSRVDIVAWMTDVGATLSFDDIGLDAMTSPTTWPRFVPQVDTTEIAALDATAQWPAYAIGLRRVYSPRSHSILPGFTDTTAAAALGLRDDQMSILVGYGEDPLVEGFWTRRRDLYPRLAEHDWDLVLAPNFSMYGNQPRTEHLINFRRNLLVAEELLDAGVNAVPNLYWYRLEDLERYDRWLADTTPPAVATNLQTFRTEADWTQMALPGLHYLAAVLPAGTRFVATGTSRQDRLNQLVALFGDRLTVISQNPIQYARHGAVMTAQGRIDVHAAVPDAFATSVRFYNELLAP